MVVNFPGSWRGKVSNLWIRDWEIEIKSSADFLDNVFCFHLQLDAIFKENKEWGTVGKYLDHGIFFCVALKFNMDCYIFCIDSCLTWQNFFVTSQKHAKCWTLDLPQNMSSIPSQVRRHCQHCHLHTLQILGALLKTQCQDKVRTYSAGTHIMKVVKWG